MKIRKLTKKLLSEHLNTILKETCYFKFQNWKRENYLLDLPHKWDVSIISLDGEKPIGFSICSIKKNVYYIHFFYVFRKKQGFNIGKKILKRNIFIAKKVRRKTLQLMCSTENIPALNFYFRNKFYIKAIDKNTGQYLMERKLF